MTKLNFRLTTPKSGSIAASTQDEALNAELLDATTDLVMDALRKMDWHPTEKEGRVPEVLSDATLAQIEALEAALEFCRNLLIDSSAREDDLADDIERAIGMASDALGYGEDVQ